MREHTIYNAFSFLTVVPATKKIEPDKLPGKKKKNERAKKKDMNTVSTINYKRMKGRGSNYQVLSS